MKALLWTSYGGLDGLKYGDAPRPEPRPGEVILRVKAAGLNAADLHLLKGKPFPLRFQTGLLRPRYTALGADVAGVVETVGPGVTTFQPGDRVFGDLSGLRWGGLAEYAAADPRVLARLPDSIPFETAAAVPMAAVTAYLALVETGGLQPGASVLVHGASGGVGTFAVQIAKAWGARITAVCSTRNLELVRGLGADEVVDYQKQDFTDLGPRFQVVLAANGDRKITDYGKVLVPGGVVVISGGSMGQIFQGLLQGPWLSRGPHRYRSAMGRPDAAVLSRLAEWLAAGAVKPVIDQAYPLAEGIEAFRCLQEGRRQGKVVVTIE